VAECVVEGCSNAPKIRQYCQTCYNRLWRSGELPERHKDPEMLPAMPYKWKPRPEAVRKEKLGSSIRLSYAQCFRNYGLCSSVEMRLHWREKMNECLRQAAQLGLSEEDLRSSVDQVLSGEQ
jgi:hypothetical protein